LNKRNAAVCTPPRSPSIPSSDLLRFVLWGDEAPGRYEVLHLSLPHLSEIPAGRRW
jgi:hypothetical protein